MRIEGQRALLTGATGGIGGAIARELARSGARLVLTGRRVDVLEPLAKELGAEAVACDLTDSDALAELVERAGTVDLLISNAGLPASGTVDDYTVEQIDRAIDVNLRAPILLARALVPGMVERRHGHVVLVSSLAGKLATPGSAIYAATKFGLRGFASALRQDLRGTGVGVSSLFPGIISDVGMFADAGVEIPPNMTGVAGMRRSSDVAKAVLRAIERNRAEIDVTAPHLKAAAMVASVAPRLVEEVQAHLPARDVAEQFVEGQRAKR